MMISNSTLLVQFFVVSNNAKVLIREASSGDNVTLSFGLTYGKTMLPGSGNGLGLNIGVYSLVEKPEHAPDWQLKNGASYYFNWSENFSCIVLIIEGLARLIKPDLYTEGSIG